jgi:NitT/TauT family transport system substrate-binding protein
LPAGNGILKLNIPEMRRLRRIPVFNLKDFYMKALKAGIIAVSLAFFLSACGGDRTSEAAGTPAAPAANTAAPAEKAEQKVIKVAYLPITHALPAFEAASAEMQDENVRIELIRFGSWTELIDAINAGRVDGAFALAELVMKAREQGMDVYLSALAHRDGNVIVAADGIKSMQDLRGKTFAIPHRQSSHYILLNEALAKEGVDISEINIIELPPPEMPSALAAGRIAGYCVAEPFGARAVTLKIGHVLYNSQDLWPDSICCALALSGRFLREHPELAAVLLSRVRKAGLRLEQDHEHAISLAGEFLKAPKDALELSLKWIHFDNLDIGKEQYDSLAAKVKNYGLSQAPVPYEDIVKNVR